MGLVVQTSKTRRRLLSVTSIWLGLCYAALGRGYGEQQVTLGWTASIDPIVVGYYVYYGSTNGVYNNKVDVGTNTMYTVPGLADGSTNYFSATSYNAAGVESSFVPQVSYVVPGILTVTAASVSRAFGQANPIFTGTITGLQNGDNITATYSTTATPTSPVGTYFITPTLVDPDNRQTNYTVIMVNGTLAVIGSPVIQTPNVTGSSFALTWDTLPSQKYQVQSTTDLDQNNWTNLGGAITASNSNVSISEPIGTNERQFYRVVLSP
jgi:hypothetical protein